MDALKDATVLVVDDEPDLCDMLAFEFRMQGSRVLAASDGDGAFRLIQSQRIDAVVTDIQMAHGTGVQLLDRIRATHNNHEPVVVFITAYDTALSPIDAYDRGAEGYFGKPFRLKDLIERVQRGLTIPNVRWAEPPQAPPEVLIQCRFNSLATARDQRTLDVARGGFAMWADESPQIDAGQPIGFRLAFQTGPIESIEGAGTVRWVLEGRNSKAACGIEFDYLTPGCRDKMIEWLADNPSRPFIPRLTS